ncbi:hypothetical protein MMC13_007898 [Lambiella insularis]|nr:hypothetical protein [Lambiella insularis]
MTTRSVADYLTRAPEIPNEDELFGLLAKEFSPFPPINCSSTSASASRLPLPEKTTNSRLYHRTVRDPQPIDMDTLGEAPQWTVASSCSPIYHESHYSEPQQEFFRTVNEDYYMPGASGKPLPDTQWGSSHHPRFPFASMAHLRDNSQQVNDTTNSLVGSASQRSLQSHYRISPTYYPEPIKQESTSSVYPPRYHPFSSDIYKTSVNMDTSYQNFAHFENPSSVPLDRQGTERYATISPDIPHRSSGPVIASTTNDEDTDGALSSEPYAQLIFRALKSVPDHSMVLKDIYEWFEKNTDKAKDNTSKGWQNSIRHNLSMNGAFRKADLPPPTDEGKKGCIWVLDKKALENGVESTTRYRKVGAHKKNGRTEPVTAQRQRSGARGGKAAKKSARLRRTPRYEEPRRTPLPEEELVPEPPPVGTFCEDYAPADVMELYDFSALPYFRDTPSTTKHSSIADTQPYGFEDITGVASGLENEPLFCDSTEKIGMDQTLFGYSLCCSDTHGSGCDFDSIT